MRCFCGARLPKPPPPSKRRVPEGADVTCRRCGMTYSGNVLDLPRAEWRMVLKRGPW